MELLNEIGIEYLGAAMLIAFFYSDNTIIWIMIENGEITKTVKQKPHQETGNLTGLCGSEEGS